jgi:murein DD-endopeptidase MepM/ murein hydrolase activator NlpD
MAKWTHPVKKVKLGSKFGVIDQWHTAPGHRGVDYNGFGSGEPLMAVSDGKIVLVKFSEVLGNVVVLQVGKVFFGYCHMVKPCALKVGTKVTAGQVIGHAGTTGTASFGVHLHMSLAKNKEGVFYGRVYDAYGYIQKRIAEAKAAVAPKAAVLTEAPAVVAAVKTPTAPKKGSSIAE